MALIVEKACIVGAVLRTKPGAIQFTCNNCRTMDCLHLALTASTLACAVGPFDYFESKRFCLLTFECPLVLYRRLGSGESETVYAPENRKATVLLS